MHSLRRCFTTTAAVLLLAWPASAALAFGGGLPAGPAVPPVATEDGKPVADGSSWTLGAGWAWTAASLGFDKGGNVALDQQSVFASADRNLPGGWGLRLVGGALVSGTLNAAGGTTTGEYKLSSGWALGIGATRKLLEQRGKKPWVRGTAAITYGHSHADVPQGASGTLSNWDFRAGATVGWHIVGGLDLYAVGRGFLGPVTWSSHTFSDSGSDRLHVQLGIGGVYQVLDGVALHIEGCPLGERSVVVGAALAL